MPGKDLSFPSFFALPPSCLMVVFLTFRLMLFFWTHSAHFCDFPTSGLTMLMASAYRGNSSPWEVVWNLAAKPSYRPEEFNVFILRAMRSRWRVGVVESSSRELITFICIIRWFIWLCTANWLRGSRKEIVTLVSVGLIQRHLRYTVVGKDWM